MAGFDQPVDSLIQIGLACVRLSAIAAFIAAVGVLMVRHRKPGPNLQVALGERAMSDAGKASTGQVWALLLLSVSVFLFIPLAGMQWEKGPYLAMPVLLVAIIAVAIHRYRRDPTEGSQSVLLAIVGIYALASLARVFLRVRSGGAYSSYLLPASVILFTHCWVEAFPGLFTDSRRRTFVRGIVVGLLFAWITVTAAVIGIRYRLANTYPVRTPRGTIIALPDLGVAVEQAISFLDEHTAPRDPVAVMPEGTSIDFFTDRTNPLREEITTPGFLDEDGERRAIDQLIASNTRVILITNRPTAEFGARVFGVDYCRRLMAHIEENYELRSVLGLNPNPSLQIGDRIFFIRAYVKRDPGDAGISTSDGAQRFGSHRREG
jgi:hypothetical protein